MGGAEFEVCGRHNACPFGYPVLIPRAWDYVPLHGKRHCPLVADNMGLVSQGDVRDTRDAWALRWARVCRSGPGRQETRGNSRGVVRRCHMPEAEHDSTGIQWVWQPVTSPSTV